ncbi:MAG: DUF438 domain-containing protein [Spirochaetota bacterium]
MTQGPGRERKKEIMKDIILKLHGGLSVEEARNRFLEEVGNINSVEIAEIEQSLINEGLSPEEIRRFCNVHALLFESSLKQSLTAEESPSHPVYLFKLENRGIENVLEDLGRVVAERSKLLTEDFRNNLRKILEKFRGVEIHYTKKEQVLFPFLEKHGFFGPSKVMWGKDDEIRALLNQAITSVQEGFSNEKDIDYFISTHLNPLIEEVRGMIFKEESILFPTAIEKLSVDEWVEVLKEGDKVGYAFIKKPEEIETLGDQFLRTFTEEPEVLKDHMIKLPSGEFTLKALVSVLNTLPVDITFIDDQDRVKYFSEGKERIFLRTRSVLGRKVQNCHPPQSVDRVNKILDSFKNGSRDVAEFWINYRGRFVHIRYFAVRDVEGRYLGTLEVSQDITHIKELKGERRLLDDY